MDTSDEYVDMCKAATKIQDDWNPLVGNVVTTGDLTGIYVGHTSGCPPDENDDADTSDLRHIYWAEWCSHNWLWLPRQDQLQAMFDLPVKFGLLSINQFFQESEKYCIDFTSWEQLWLAYVMYKRFDQTWCEHQWK